jgi:protein-tyrosine phosphatase
MKILMVCLGNICRSPLAQGILEQKVAQRGLNWTVDSAGTGSWHAGDPPDPRSIAIARQYGLDISRQRARQVRSSDFEEFDVLLAMDTSNHRDLLRMAISEEERRKIDLILHFTQPNSQRSVPDPYWDDNGFDQVFRMLDEACERLIEQWG